MSADEWIVEVSDDDSVIGKVEREEAHRLGKLKRHREVMVLIYTNTEHTKFLLQHRSMQKKQLPGYWTLSATGHVDWQDMSNDDPDGYLTAASRETSEELGVKLHSARLVGKINQDLEMNEAVMGIVIGECEGEVKLDPKEVDEVAEYNNISVLDIGDKLTPGAKACLKYLKLI